MDTASPCAPTPGLAKGKLRTRGGSVAVTQTMDAPWTRQGSCTRGHIQGHAGGQAAHVGAVGGGNANDGRGRRAALKAVQLGQQLVQRLLALVVAHAAQPRVAACARARCRRQRRPARPAAVNYSRSSSPTLRSLVCQPGQLPHCYRLGGPTRSAASAVPGSVDATPVRLLTDLFCLASRGFLQPREGDVQSSMALTGSAHDAHSRAQHSTSLTYVVAGAA